MQKNILVVGGNSLIGQEVIKLANSEGDSVFATSRSTIDIPLKNFIYLDPNEVVIIFYRLGKYPYWKPPNPHFEILKRFVHLEF